MARLIIGICTKSILSAFIAWIAVLLFHSLLIFSESTLQTVLVLGFYIYCLLVLALPSQHKLFHVLSIPVLSQFLHLFQKYDFPAGANSLWRLFPFIVADLYIISILIRFRTELSSVEKGIVTSWILLNFLFIVISPNLPGIITGAFTLTLFTVPLYFVYLSILSKHPLFQADMEQALCLCFIILTLGTFGLVFFGAQYKGASNLLVTRNISDTNVTMVYFILLWPFALRYAHRTGHMLLTPLLVLLFVLVVVLSFSRGALFIVFPYLLTSLLILSSWKQALWFAMIGILLGAGSGDVMSLMNADLAYSWQLRLADIQAVGPALQKIQEVSGRAEIRRLAHELFLESPLYGHGTGSFEILGPGYREAHSMLFTILAEQGLAGMLYFYGLFGALGYHLLGRMRSDCHLLLSVALGAYLLFVHSVGFVFVILPTKSLTINCIAPILLLCTYYYSKSVFAKPAAPDYG